VNKSSKSEGGVLGQLSIGGIISGAKEGGLAGAIAGLVDLFISESEGLKTIFDTLNGIVSGIVNAFNPIFEAVGALVTNVVTPLMDVLKGLLGAVSNLIVRAIEPLNAVMEPVLELFELIRQIFNKSESRSLNNFLIV